MTDSPFGGGLHDLSGVAKHFYYENKRNNKDADIPLAFVGAITVAIGAKILYDVGTRSWARHVKQSKPTQHSR